MKIVKLHATTSTNDELRLRFRESVMPHLTALYSLSQSQGRGNRGTIWQSEDGKNLTFSVLVTDGLSGFSAFQLNKTVSIAMVEWLRDELSVQAKIKWPNDILSVNKKLAGILIENTFSGQQIDHSIIGIGLNVNQEEFINLPQAISLKNITGKDFILEQLLVSFLNYLDKNLKNPDNLDQRYLNFLYRYKRATRFEINGKEILATVYGVTENGNLLLKIDEQITAYDLKQVRWLY